jgi:nucleoside 2-deoxyribosyltransferase
MTAYISVSLNKRKLAEAVLMAVSNTLKDLNITAFIFVDKYLFAAGEERKMMQQAMSDIDNCDLLIAETSDKAIGIGAEVGYAKAKGKPIVYIRHKDAEHSTTVSGMSDYQVIYTDTSDLKAQLTDALNKVLKN